MLKIFKYTFYDMIRNRWLISYTLFYLILTVGLLSINNDFTKVIISLSNISLILAPLVGILYGVIYYYSSAEFLNFLLVQPLSRVSIFTGFSLSIALSLAMSVTFGMGLPLIFYGVLASKEIGIFLLVMVMSTLLTIIFALISLWIGLRNNNRIKGFGSAIFLWLFFAVIYDGLSLLLLLLFREYPLESLTLGLIATNPIDLARILIIMNLDVSAVMGYTGAVLQDFLGNTNGAILIVCVLSLWMVVPFLFNLRIASRKDF